MLLNAPKSLKLVITMDLNGQIRVEGPIDNETVAMRMLVLGGKAILDHNLKQAASRLVLPSGVAAPVEDNGNGRSAL